MLLINDFFGTMGSGLALAGRANLLDEDGNFPAFGKVFLVDSASTILGSVFGISTVSCFAESALFSLSFPELLQELPLSL